MGMLETINDFLKSHHLRDVVKELKQEIRNEKYIERIDEEIIKLCDESIRHAKQRKENIVNIEQVKGFRTSGHDARSLVHYYTQVNKVVKRFNDLNEEEHDNQGTMIRMNQLVRKDYELFQRFSRGLKKSAPHVYAELDERLGDFLDKRHLKETLSKFHNDERWVQYGDQEGLAVERDINIKIKSLKSYSEREGALVKEAKERIDREYENVEEKFKAVLADKRNPEKISAAVSSLKRLFLEFPKQQLDSLIDPQISALDAIKLREVEKKDVFAKIESVLISEELLLVKLDKGELQYDSSITLVFPKVEVTRKQMTRFIVDERVRCKRKHIISMGEMYKKAGKKVDFGRIKYMVESDRVKEEINEEAAARLTLILRNLKMRPTRYTIMIYRQVAAREDELSSRTGSLERHVMRATAREFLPQKIKDNDQLTELNFLNILAYAFFLKLNKKILEKTFNQIPKVHHVREEIDYIALTDALIKKKFQQNIFEEDIGSD